MIDILMIIFHVQYRQPAEPATIAQKGSDTVIRLRVKELAEAKGFNQSSLSRASDVSFLTIKRIFRDPHKDVAMSTLEKLARALVLQRDFLWYTERKFLPGGETLCRRCMMSRPTSQSSRTCGRCAD